MKRVLLMAIAALVVGSTNAQDIHKKIAANAKNAHRIEMQTSKSNKFEIAGAKAGVKAIDSNKKMNAKNAVKAKNIKPIAQPFATAARVAAVQQTYKGYGTVRSSKESTNWDMTSGEVTGDDGSPITYLVNVIPDIIGLNDDIYVPYTVEGNNIVIEPQLIASFQDEEAPTGTYYLFLEDLKSTDGAIRLAMDDNGNITGSYNIGFSIYPAETYNYDDFVGVYDAVDDIKYNIPGVTLAPEVRFEQGNLILFASLGINGRQYSDNYAITAPYATTQFTNLTTDPATSWSWKAYDPNSEEESVYAESQTKDFSVELTDGAIHNVSLVGTNEDKSSDPFIYGVGKTAGEYTDCYIYAGGYDSEFMLNKEFPATMTRQDPDGDIKFYTNWATPDKADNSMSKIYMYHEKPAAPLYIEGILLPFVGFTHNEDFNLHIKIQKVTYPKGATRPTLGEVIAEGDATSEDIVDDYATTSGLTGVIVPLYVEDEDGMSQSIDYLFIEDEFVIVIEGWDNGTFSGALGSQDNPLANARTSTWFEMTGEEGSMYSYTSWRTSLFVGFWGAAYGYMVTEDATEITFPEEGGDVTLHIKPMFSKKEDDKSVTWLEVANGSELPDWISYETKNDTYTDDEYSFDLVLTADPLNSASGAPRKEAAAGRQATFSLMQPGAKLDFTVTQGTVSGISDVQVTKTTTDGKVYNIAGQRLNSNAKGLIIKDGKKMIVK